MCDNIKSVIVGVNVFIKGESEPESYDNVFLIEVTASRLTIHYFEESLHHDSYPLSSVDFYQVNKEIEYWEKELDEEDGHVV